MNGRDVVERSRGVKPDGRKKKEAERKDSRAMAVKGKTGQGDEGGLMLAGHPHARTAEDVGTYEKKRFRRMV